MIVKVSNNSNAYDSERNPLSIFSACHLHIHCDFLLNPEHECLPLLCISIHLQGLTEKFKEKDKRYTGSATLTYETFMSMIIPFLVAD